MDQIYIPINKFKVLVLCHTYNQSNYIIGTLNGFVIQKTNFNYTCLIMDDCSTDGEQELLKSWINHECDIDSIKYEEICSSYIVLATHKVNRNCNFAFYFLKENMYKSGWKKTELINPWRALCEYEAMCEGDDYWTDPLKLHKQVCYVESHPNVSLCFTNVDVCTEIKNDDTSIFHHLEERDYGGNEIIETWTIPTCTVLYTINVLKQVPQDCRFKVGDNVLFLSAASIGNVHCINDKTAVYRRNQSGWSGSCKAIEQYQGMLTHCNALRDHFPRYSKGIKSVIVRYYIRIGWRMLKEKNPQFIVYALKGFFMNPIKFFVHLNKLVTSHKF